MSNRTNGIIAALCGLGIIMGTLLRTHPITASMNTHTVGQTHYALHVTAFAVFGWFLAGSASSNPLRVTLTLLGLLLGAGTEMYESIIGGTALEYADICLNWIGVAISLAAYLYVGTVLRPSRRVT